MSDTFGLHPQLLRGLQLKDLGRYADAESAFRTALSHEPNDAFALHHLAGCEWQMPGRHKDALQTIDRAISLQPQEASHHILRAFILCALDRPKEALTTARLALGIDPNDSSAHAAIAGAYLQLEDWPQAEQAARQALALDADNTAAANQLAVALRLQNKMAENDAHLAGLLARDPEDAFTHASVGWSALQRGQHREAETHFREALRLDPDLDHAREGLLNSFRARSPLYRGYLKYCFAMARLNAGARWAVIIGLYLLVRLSRSVLTGPYRPVAIGIAALYFMFVLWVWVARGVGNFILLFDPFARYALRRNEKIEAIAVGGGLALGLPLVLVGIIFNWSVIVLGIALVAVTFPLSMVFVNEARLGVYLFGTIAAITLIGALLWMLMPWVPALAVAEKLFIVGAVGCIATTWLGNFRLFRK